MITSLDNSEFYISEYARKNAKIVPSNSVLVTCIGIVGKVVISEIDCAINQQINAIIPNQGKCIAEYLAYLIQYKQPDLQSRANAAVVPILNKTQFSEIEFDLPPLNIQEVVVNKLNVLNKTIVLRKEQLDALDQLVKSRFTELFGDVIHNSKAWQMRVFADIASSRLGKMLDAKQQSGKYSYPYLANFNVQWFRFNIENLNQMDFDENNRV